MLNKIPRIVRLLFPGFFFSFFTCCLSVVLLSLWTHRGRSSLCAAHNSFVMWPHLQPHRFTTAAVLIAKPKYNWVMRNKFIVRWPCLRITAWDVCVLRIINKIEHAHPPLWAKYSFLSSVWSERAGMCREIEYLYVPLCSEGVDIEKKISERMRTLSLSFPGWG